jgi:hypothetical protein
VRHWSAISVVLASRAGPQIAFSVIERISVCVVGIFAFLIIDNKSVHFHLLGIAVRIVRCSVNQIFSAFICKPFMTADTLNIITVNYCNVPTGKGYISCPFAENDRFAT